MSIANFVLSHLSESLGVRVDMFRNETDEGTQIVLITGAYSAHAGQKPRHRLTTIGKLDGSDTPYVATTSRGTLKRLSRLLEGDKSQYLGWSTVDIDWDGCPEQSFCRDLYYKHADYETDALEDSTKS
ncbi:conserved hypothetical protein [Vibrio phage 150E35-1]|nr:conserved hypothetical protein [Vibrio phage 150E35-1]